jgi:glycosyltransferase involved in cell wall biosynthesis
VLTQSGGGVAVPPGDAGLLAEAIQTLANDPELRDRLGEAGADYVRREFNRSVWAGRYLQILTTLNAGTANGVPYGAGVS